MAPERLARASVALNPRMGPGSLRRMKRSTWATGAVACSLLITATSAAAGRDEMLSSPPHLTRNVPRFVTQVCASARRSRPPLPIVCPPLVPVTRYRPFPGSSGVLLGNTNIPRLKPPTDHIYLLSFNGGDSGPAYWHWMAGIGSHRRRFDTGCSRTPTTR
jgi:hypothetical protein